MKKLGGILNGLKTVAKFSIYAVAFLKIIQYAIDTIEDLQPKEPQNLEANEQILSE
ncbi:hypothetical protein [Flavobacterium sp. FlaQc-50]|jgi:hypothetical protein|uniref:hypothetical protein n=1 Tax=unclassified Flavobacterium TaxID=196869 RepID=UPI003756EB62